MKKLLRALLLLTLCLPLRAEEIVWLKNARLEAGFTAGAGIRLAVLRVPGGNNVFRESNTPLHGLKTWVMTPIELEQTRAMLSECPADIEVTGERELRLRTREPNAWGLVLEWEVRIDPEAPVLTIRHRIHNMGAEHRQLGIWSLAAFAPGTVFEVPFVRPAEVPAGFPNNVAVFPFTDLADGRIRSTAKALFLDIREGAESGSVKLGVVQPQGLALVRRGDLTLKISAPYIPGAQYPEGGSNITLYASPASQPSTMGEVEHLGPLQVIGAGDSMELLQTLELR